MVYRLCKTLLEHEMVPHGTPRPPLRGYEKAIDPDLIKTIRVFSSGPSRLSLPMLTPEESEWRRFVWRVDQVVNRKLSKYQRRIIRLRYLGKEPLPADREVYNTLYESGWYESWSHFRRQKSRALATLSVALGVIASVESEPEFEPE
jgi:hypothetical protein